MAPYRDPPRPEGPACPRCRVATALLRSTARGGVRFQHCLRCEGCWIERGNLEEMLRTPAARADVLEGMPGRARHVEVAYAILRCPGCGKPMRRLNVGGTSGIVSSVCADHGAWFDRGDLSAIVRFVDEQSELAPDRSELMKKVAGSLDRPPPRGEPLPRGNDDEGESVDFVDVIALLLNVWP